MRRVVLAGVQHHAVAELAVVQHHAPRFIRALVVPVHHHALGAGVLPFIVDVPGHIQHTGGAAPQLRIPGAQLGRNHIEEMARETMVMLIQSLEAYVEKDLDKAQKVIAHDDVIDDLFEEVKQELIELIRNHADEGEQAVDLLMVTKYFERIGDHATNIAEWVIFSITGQIAG